MLRDVILYGEMAERFGHKFRLDVASLAEAARALGCQLKGFKQYLVQHDYHVVCGDIQGTALVLDADRIGFGLPAGALHITPVLQAAKNTGVGKIIAGVMIAAVAWWAIAPWGLAIGAEAGLGFGTPIIGGLTVGNVAMLGLGLAALGIASLLTPKAKATASFMMSGQTNSTEQGNCVPLIYGTILVGSVLISCSVSNADIPITDVPTLSTTVIA